MKFSLTWWINRLLMGGVVFAALLTTSYGRVAQENPPAKSASLKNLIIDNMLIIGWFDSEPYYTFIKHKSGEGGYSGLDVELAKAIASSAGYKVKYKPIQWKEQIHNIETGKQHFIASATFTEERAKFAYFSDAYRKEKNAFFVRKGDGAKFIFTSGDMKGFVDSIKANKAKIAIAAGMVYASKEINDFINDSNNQPYLVTTATTYESIDLLLKHEIDGILDDRVNTSAIIWRTKNISKIEEVYLGIEIPIHFMFSKKSVPESIVAEFNAALKNIQADGTYSKITREHMFPILILQTIERPWFFFLEAFAIMALVLSGLIIAYQEKFNLCGTMLLAFFSMSGGVIRDVLLNRPRLGITLTPVYALGMVILVVCGFAVVWVYQLLLEPKFRAATISKKRENQLRNAKITYGLVEILDAFGLAAYTVTGVVVTLVSQLDPLWLWGPIMAAISTTGGGILRDIIRGKTDILLFKKDFYGEIAIIWGVVLSLVFTRNSEITSPETMFNWIMFVVVGSLLTRGAVKLCKFRGIPFNPTA